MFSLLEFRQYIMLINYTLEPCEDKYINEAAKIKDL